MGLRTNGPSDNNADPITPGKTHIHRQSTLLPEHKTIWAKTCRFMYTDEQCPVKPLHQPIAGRVIWSCPSLMSTTQKTQLLHQIIFKFPTLVRMDDGRHPESIDNQLKKLISNGQCRFVGQWAGLRPPRKTVHYHQYISITL